MSENVELNLEGLGRDVAQDVAGAENVEQVEVAEGVDWAQKPAYYFVFLIDKNREGLTPGALSSRIRMRIRDELLARGDYHMPYTRILPRHYWDKRGRAWPH